MARKFLSGIDSKFVKNLDDPLLPLDAANRQWVLGLLNGVNTIFTTELEPTPNKDGDAWHQTSTSLLTIYKTDGFKTVKVEEATTINDGYF